MLKVEELTDRLIDLSFAEDIGDGDHTTLCCIPEDAMGKSRLLIKEDGILAGVEVAKEVFQRFAAHVALFALELGNDLVDLELHLCFVIGSVHAVKKLFKAR